MIEWLSGVAGALGGWMVNPWLFLAGGAAVAAPIVIHLLNKRKFRTVDWAAMEFLLEADKRNRRRVRLENLLLLLLRCLIVLLLGLLVARPFLSAGLAGKLFDSVRFERIVIVDDSPSMQVRSGSTPSIAAARQGLDEFVAGLASNTSDDSLTLYRTSQPNRPLFNGLHIDQDTVAEVRAEIKELEVSDLPNRLEATLLEVEKSLAGRDTGINRVVYLLGDLRNRDWSGGGSQGAQGSVVETLNRLAGKTAGCFLVDLGSDEVNNLVVAEIAPRDKALISGVASTFDVTVRNVGASDAKRVKVKFAAGETVPIEREIEAIAAGKSASVPFTYTFARPEAASDEKLREPVPIRVELVSEEPATEDRLEADSSRNYAARVVAGIPTLVVDGDPSAVYGKSESFYLRRALVPPGEELSGVDAQTVTDVEFENVKLEDYQVIYLCNVYRLSEARRAALDAWVRKGGGLIFFLGDQVDKDVYNEELYQEGKGLLPMKLEAIEGDEDGQKWAFFSIESKNHPMLKVFVDVPESLESVKLFRYWTSTLADGAVPARFTNTDRSPAIVEKAHGAGRIVAIASTADVEWNNWAQDPSFTVLIQDLTQYIARASAGDGSLAVGEPILQSIDVTRYKLTDVGLTAPNRAKTVLQAAPPTGNGGPKKAAGDETIWQIDYEDTDRRGFYQLELTRSDGEKEHVLFAANLDPSEGDLSRADQRGLAAELGESVKIIDNQALLGLGTDAAKGELWLYVLVALVALLALEQLLGWWFGRSR